MSDQKCKYCGSPLGFCVAGEYCTNELCSYADGNYSGPRKPPPVPERTYTQSELDAAVAKALERAAIEVKREFDQIIHQTKVGLSNTYSQAFGAKDVTKEEVASYSNQTTAAFQNAITLADLVIRALITNPTALECVKTQERLEEGRMWRKAISLIFSLTDLRDWGDRRIAELEAEAGRKS